MRGNSIFQKPKTLASNTLPEFVKYNLSFSGIK